MAANSSRADSFQSPSLPDQIDAVKAAFGREYGRPPQWIAAAPGRVNLIGEHTDYNAGFVFPLAIERYVVMAAAEGSGYRARGSEVRSQESGVRAGGEPVRLFSTLLEKRAEFNLDALEPQRRDWTSYVRGAFAGCLERGFRPGSLDVLIDSHVPLGGGLSSSAALEMATATLLEAVTGHMLDPVDKARLCQKAEHVYANMPCGIMDQFSSALGAAGKLLLIDCRTETAELVALDDPDVAVLVINSNVKHELTGSEYPERRAACEQAARLLGVDALRDVTPAELEEKKLRLDDLFYRRARHVVGEIERTVRAAEALQAGDWATLGDLMYASHRSLRDDYEVSCPELDALVEIAANIGAEGGVIGSRMTGGGFGGSTVSLVDSARVREIAERITAEYRQRVGREATAFVTKPARGAHILVP